ncbi:MAG TPA: PLP-dependent aminotransferase family protein [Ktedonobacterales bacterium]|nr:PLP-dependent aminotransferase family protein [Ktedonobacterales bacterium]
MVKRAPAVVTPQISLDQNAQTPLYRQLYERLRTEILQGQLEAGRRLPSTRALASELGVSRNTTALVYQRLLLEGYIESRVGDGSRVARLHPAHHAQISNVAHARRTDAPITQIRMLSRHAQSLISTPYPGQMYTNLPADGKYVFRVGQPDTANFPHETWARIVARHARRLSRSDSSSQKAQGYLPLREAIAAHIGITRGVHCSPDQIIITAGSQGALDLTARVLLDPGDRVWVEDPGYPGARGALLAAGASLVRVPVDHEGIVVEAGRQLSSHARMAVVTPSHQFPTGVTMSLSRRLALLRWAGESQAWVTEDDYDSEYRFSGRPLEALQGLDGGRNVIYIGTFSKVMFPALRLGYLVAPAELVSGFIATRRFIDAHLPLLEQIALADFIAEGHLARHLRKMRLLYQQRRDALTEALTRELGDVLAVSVPEAGIHLTAWLPVGMSGQTVTRRAAEHGLHIIAIAQHGSQESRRDGLVLGFASDSPEELRAGVRTLARVLRTL